MKLNLWFAAVVLVLLPAMADAADISGVPRIREGDHIQIGNSRIRLGGIDAPAVDQLVASVAWPFQPRHRLALPALDSSNETPACSSVFQRRNQRP